VPVLAVPAHVDRLPRSALVNMDLGESSVCAARATLPLLAAGGSLTLAHVVPEVEFAPPDAGDWVEAGTRGVAHVLRQLDDELRLAGDLEVRSVVLKGDPASVLSGSRKTSTSPRLEPRRGRHSAGSSREVSRPTFSGKRVVWS
jgi:hypothetical protein